jgi:SAM-dependent methyltransferase
MPAPADWQLPPGVSRAVWDYAHDSNTAHDYDAGLGGTPLLEADLAFAERHVPPAARVVDLGCGTGRVSVALARTGRDVVGVDLSEPMLAVARRKATDAGISCHWAAANVVELGAFADRSFDAAVCLFSTLGMVAGAVHRQQAIQEAFRLLRPGGVFVLHVHLVGHLLTTRAGRLSWLGDAAKRVARRPDRGDFPMPARAGATGWTMHLFTRREALGLLERAGFQVVEALAVGIDGRRRRWPGRLWAYGLLLAAVRPAG